MMNKTARDMSIPSLPTGFDKIVHHFLQKYDIFLTKWQWAIGSRWPGFHKKQRFGLKGSDNGCAGAGCYGHSGRGTPFLRTQAMRAARMAWAKEFSRRWRCNLLHPLKIARNLEL
jgi:hypothetical protein